MRLLVSTSVLGLVPLPQQSERYDAHWKHDPNVEFASPQLLGFDEYCHVTQHSTSQQLVRSRRNAGRMGFVPYCSLRFDGVDDCRRKGNSELVVALNKMLWYSEIQRSIVSTLRRFFL
jgi:hypothetical protein